MTVADLNAEGAQALADEIGGRAWAVDLSDTAALADLSLDVDILVNNAGIQHVSPIEDFAPERFSFMLRLMLEAPFLLIRAALPGMYERGFGRVLNVSSVHGIRASAYKSAYVTAKHGLEGLSKTTALEGGPRGVTSVCIDPGYVRSPLVEKQLADQARAHGIPESEVLETVLLQDAAIKGSSSRARSRPSPSGSRVRMPRWSRAPVTSWTAAGRRTDRDGSVSGALPRGDLRGGVRPRRKKSDFCREFR